MSHLWEVLLESSKSPFQFNYFLRRSVHLCIIVSSNFNITAHSSTLHFTVNLSTILTVEHLQEIFIPFYLQLALLLCKSFVALPHYCTGTYTWNTKWISSPRWILLHSVWVGLLQTTLRSKFTYFNHFSTAVQHHLLLVISWVVETSSFTPHEFLDFLCCWLARCHVYKRKV